MCPSIRSGRDPTSIRTPEETRLGALSIEALSGDQLEAWVLATRDGSRRWKRVGAPVASIWATCSAIRASLAANVRTAASSKETSSWPAVACRIFAMVWAPAEGLDDVVERHAHEHRGVPRPVHGGKRSKGCRPMGPRSPDPAESSPAATPELERLAIELIAWRVGMLSDRPSSARNTAARFRLGSLGARTSIDSAPAADSDAPPSRLR
jgi:hypothetical protein